MEFADFPDNRMDTVALLDVIKRVEAFIDSSEAEIVYTHYVGDLNIDHSITARAVLTACRPVAAGPPDQRPSTSFPPRPQQQ